LANVFFLSAAKADADTSPAYPDDATVALLIAAMQNELRPFGAFPEAGEAPYRRFVTVPVTAYSSDPAQTDSTPCIAARGFDLCAHGEEDVVAANFLPIGAKIRIPDLYGLRVFTVVDRMNPRYDRRVDIWMREKADARAFGLKRATVEVL
jgi:3D (Asp-Asp-Asp) domain-containing protein